MSELPEHYNQDRFAAIARDPSTVFVYWDLAGDAMSSLESRLSEDDLAASAWTIRLTDLDTGATSTIEIEPEARNWYLDVMPGRTYVVELGVIDPGKTFHRVFPATRLRTPDPSYSQEFDKQWMILEEDYLQLLALGWAGFLGSSNGLHLPAEKEEPAFVTIQPEEDDGEAAPTSPGVPSYTERK